MSSPALVIGLGRVGALAVRQVKEFYRQLPEKERVPASFLVIEIDRGGLSTGRWEAGERLCIEEGTIGSILRNLGRSWNGKPAWGTILSWFPRHRSALTLEELEASGARNSRLVGRLGFFAHDRLIGSRLAEVFGRLSETCEATGTTRILLVSALWEGGGSGMLLDVARAMRRQEATARIAAYLLLPPSFDHVRAMRWYANTYACLRELFHLEQRALPADASEDRIPAGQAEEGGRAGLQQIFLFEALRDVDGEFLVRASGPMARAIAARLQRNIQNTTADRVADLGLPPPSHIFSTSNSCSIPLLPSEPDKGLVCAVIRLLRDSAFVAEAYGGAFSEEASERKEEEARASGVAEDSGSWAPGDPGSLSDETGYLVGRWSTIMEIFIQSRLDDLVRGIRERVERLCPEDDEDLRSVAEEIEGLRALLDPQAWRAMPDLEELRRRVYLENRRFLADSRPLLRSPRGLNQFLEHLRSSGAEAAVHTAAASAGLQGWIEKWNLVDRIQKSSESRPKWRRLIPSDVVLEHAAGLKCAAILEAIEDPAFRQHLAASILILAREGLLEEIAKVPGLEQGDALRARLVPDEPASGVNPVEIPPKLRSLLQDVVRTKGREILDEIEKIERVKELQERFVREIVIEELMFGGARYLVDWECEPEVKIGRAIESCRSHLFERFAPHPYAVAVVLLPRKVFWPPGEADLKAFLRREIQAVLACSCTVLDYEGDEIRIYYEDLFHPPESLRALESYYEAYRQEPNPEVLHIDRRLLADPHFQEIAGEGRDRVVTCGNPDCYEDLSGHPRTLRVCPACGLPIRSRCGNKGCTLDFLHLHPRGRDKACPGCAGFNHAAWWRCWNHGKIEVVIPFEKVRCPRCIHEHLDDVVAFPTERISRRPDLRAAAICPYCERREERDPSHQPFIVAPDLLPFYADGVYGDDQEQFARLVRKYKLGEGFRCPSCTTPLIPVHHKDWGKAAPGDTGGEPLGM